MSNNKQQTAVDWLLNAIETKNGVEFSSYYTEFIQQAKEMEKQQTMNFALEYMMQSKPIVDYYNETYGGNK